MSTIQDDFDRIAFATLASEDGAAHNDHYHNFLLGHLPSNCNHVLEIGCGTGSFARRLAEHLGAGSAGILPAVAGSAGIAGFPGRASRRWERRHPACRSWERRHPACNER